VYRFGRGVEVSVDSLFSSEVVVSFVVESGVPEVTVNTHIGLLTGSESEGQSSGGVGVGGGVPRSGLHFSGFSVFDVGEKSLSSVGVSVVNEIPGGIEIVVVVEFKVLDVVPVVFVLGVGGKVPLGFSDTEVFEPYGLPSAVHAGITLIYFG